MSANPPIEKSIIEDHDKWFDATFQKDFVFKDGCYSWTLAGWKAALAVMVASGRYATGVSSPEFATRKDAVPEAISISYPALFSSEISDAKLIDLIHGTWWYYAGGGKEKYAATKVLEVIRPHLGTTELVSVALEKCAIAVSKFLYGFNWETKLLDQERDNCCEIAKSVLDAAGVNYVD